MDGRPDAGSSDARCPGKTRMGRCPGGWSRFLISKGRIGCVPGVDFGANGEGYLRFCFARDRAELTGALESMKTLFA